MQKRTPLVKKSVTRNTKSRPTPVIIGLWFPFGLISIDDKKVNLLIISK